MSEGVIQEHSAGLAARSETQAHHAHDRGLLAIGVFKLLKSAFFFAVGIGAIHMLHKDLGDMAMRVSMALKFDPEGKFAAFLVQKVDLIDTHHLKEFGVGTFAYSALALVEGTGLMLEKVWAEFLTLGLTISFLPWELYEIARGPDVVKFTLLLANLVVLGYLVWLLRRKKKAAGHG